MKKLFIVVLSVFLAVNLFADDDMDKVMSAIESGLAGFGDQSAVNKVRKTKKRRAKKQLDRDAQNRNGKHGFTVNDLDAGGVAKTVEATGDGSSYEEALRAAYKDAVNQVVGAYTHTETQTRNDELVSEETSLIADANVVKHVLLSKEENDGVITIRIKATVVKNESVKDLSQKKTNEVSDGEIANLLNKIDVVEQAEDSLEDIFNNYGEQVFTVEKVGNLSLGPVDFDSKGLLNVLMKFEVAVNPAGFKRFTNRLDMLLDKIALAKKSGYESSSRYWKSMQSFYQKNHPTGSKSITIIHFSGSNVKYNIYIVHAKIYERIVEFLHSPAMVFQFYSKQSQAPTLRVIVRNDDRLDSNYTNFKHFSYEYEERKKNEEHSNNDRNNNSEYYNNNRNSNSGFYNNNRNSNSGFYSNNRNSSFYSNNRNSGYYNNNRHYYNNRNYNDRYSNERQTFNSSSVKRRIEGVTICNAIYYHGKVKTHAQFTESFFFTEKFLSSLKKFNIKAVFGMKNIAKTYNYYSGCRQWFRTIPDKKYSHVFGRESHSIDDDDIEEEKVFNDGSFTPIYGKRRRIYSF